MTMPTLGIVGGGQLARMTALAAGRLAVPVLVLAADRDEGVRGLAPVLPGGPDDLGALRRLAERVDVVTFDHERVDVRHVAALEEAGHVVRPGSRALGFADKLVQREAFVAAGLPVPAFSRVAGAQDLTRFGEEHGWPLVLKLARGGYDGRGVVVEHGLEAASRLVGQPDTTWVAEPLLPLDAELAVLVVRRPGGEQVAYPPVTTVQVDGMCREVLAPVAVDQAIADRAAAVARTVAEHVGAVGVLAVELFVAGGQVLVNEVAPRPHNTGHPTIDGHATSQFENHLRAVLDWPLGPTALRAPAVAMVNVVGRAGDPRARLPQALAAGDAHIHLYAKTARPGRKLGHVTALGADLDTALATARRVTAILEAGDG